MAILTVHSLSLSFGEVPVLQNVSFPSSKKPSAWAWWRQRLGQNLPL